MIYVVEIGGKPAKLRSAAGVAAYLTEDKAKAAARTMGGRVVPYCLLMANEASEELARDVLEWKAHAAAYKADFEAELDGKAAMRSRYGAHENETMSQWIARLHRGYREWGRMMAALREFYREPTRDGE